MLVLIPYLLKYKILIMKHLTKTLFVFFAFIFLACSSPSESNLEMRSEVIKHYSATNYKLIAVEARIPYGDKIYRWYKGSAPNWIGNRWEHYVNNDLKMVFDTTANFQVIDHGNKTSEIQWTEKARLKNSNGAFEIIKMNGQKQTQIFQGLYGEGEVSKKAINQLTSYQIKLLFPAHHVIRFTGDTLDLFYKNQEAVTGSQFITYSFIRSN
jgi:hypothetical protein